MYVKLIPIRVFMKIKEIKYKLDDDISTFQCGTLK